MATSTFQRTFAGGELAPALTARADLIKYVSGLRRCRNFMVQRSGGVVTRPGTKFVEHCKTDSSQVTLHKYVSEVAGESLLLECGADYIRFFKNGGLVTLSGVAAYDPGQAYTIGDIVESGGTNYYCVADAAAGDAPPDTAFWAAMSGDVLELPSPFGGALFNVSQSGRVLTLTSTNGTVAPYELINGGDNTTWVLRPVVTAPTAPIPQGLVGTPGAAGALTYAYQVTAAKEGSYEESLSAGVASVPATAAPTTAAPIQLTWTAIPGVPEYYIYCDPFGNGTFGFVGTATGINTFNDTGFIPDFAVTPPLVNEPFKDAGNYPRRSGSHQQRRLFANTNNVPDAVWGSKVGFISNFAISSPLQDDDSISFKIAGNQHNPVRHIVGLKTLVVLTDGGVWPVGAPLQPLTPSSLFANQEGYVGCDPEVEPVVVGNAIIYLQARGSIIRDLRFDQEVEGLAGKDLTIFSSHLFDGYTITSMDYQHAPHSTVWCCRSDGTLLGMTYLREQDVWGWHRHDSAYEARFEHVCVVPEQGEDALYVIVRRTSGPDTYVRWIERFERREIMSYDVDAYCVDGGLSYAGPPATTFSGLDHLNGAKVAVLADGVVVSNGLDDASLIVAGGAVTLPAPAAPATGYSNVHIGLAFVPQIETLDLDVGGAEVIRDKKKNVKSVTLLLDKSSRDFWSGVHEARLNLYKFPPHEEITKAYSGPVEQAVTTDYNALGRVFIEVRAPVPLAIMGIIPNTELGG